MIPRITARLLCAAGFALLLVVPRIARSQDDATMEMARQRFKEGVQFYDQRQYEKARLAFLQSYAIKPHPATLLNLAQSELRGGRPDDAAGHFADYIRTNTEANEGEKQEAELGFAASKSKVGEITLAVDAPGAQISVDGRDKGTAPLGGPLYLMPGSRTVEARSGDRRASKSINVSAGQSASLSLSLRGAGAAAAAPPAGGGTPPKAAPEEDEEEDEEEEAAAPVDLPETPEGGELHATSAGRKPFFRWLLSSPVGIVGAGVGVVGIGVGGTFALLANQDYSDADSLKQQITTTWANDQLDFPGIGDGPCNLTSQTRALLPPAQPNRPSRAEQYDSACAKFTDAADAGDSKKPIAIAAGIIGGVAIVGTVVYYFIDPRAKEQAAAPGGFRAQLLPILAPGQSGIGVVGQF